MTPQNPHHHPEVDLPLPNVYLASVTTFEGDTHHLYVAADFSGSAIKKLQNLCAERHGFRPYRSNSVIKLRRFRLRDYLETPGALMEAIVTAHQLGERDTLVALSRRADEVRTALAASRAAPRPVRQETPQPIDADALCQALGEALRSVGQG